MPSSDRTLAAVGQEHLLARLQPRLKVEDYFNRSGRTFRKSRFRLWFNRVVKTAILRWLFKLFGIYERGLRNAISPAVNRLELRFPGLPPGLSGLEILHVSDLHIDEIDGLTEALTPLLEPLRPDLCVVTGDYRWEISGPCDAVYPRLNRILEAIHAPLGVVGVLGNHDAAEIALNMAARGVRMLVNDSTSIERNGSVLWIGGTDDPFDYRCADLDLTLASAPEDSFRLLLTHTPELYREAAARGVQLYLCGHTHAGQLRLPWLGAVKKNAAVPRRFVQGHWTEGSMQGYTSWGAGCSTLNVRYNCPPEVTMIRLLPG